MPFSTNTPQAAVQERRDSFSLLRAAVTTQPGTVVKGPRIVTANGEALPKVRYAAFRQLQNCGILPVKYLVADTGDCSADNFHGILAACTAVDDGLGSVVQFGITGERVTLFSTGAIRVAVFEGEATEGAYNIV